MGNIKNFDFRKLEIKLSNSDYWDFYLSDDATSLTTPNLTDCLIASFDFNNSDIFTSGSPNIISSLATWSGAMNTGYTFNTIGLTGIDNGLVTFVKHNYDTTNQALLSALTASTLYIPSGDTRLHLNKVSGMTGNFIYPVDVISGISGTYAKFCGGFYQGYYKIDGTHYQVLPNRFNKSYVLDFTLIKDSTGCNLTGNTLNNTYPNNKGFFFYIGTRAENKFWNNFGGLNTGCTSACTTNSACTGTVTTWCTSIKENQIAINSLTDSATTITLSPNQTITNIIENPFLIYGRAGAGNYYPCNSEPSGFGNETVYSFSGGTK
jgi:hypothetical protein